MLLFRGKLLPLSVAASLTLSAMPVALAGPGDLNSVNNGPTIHGGVYDNTPGSRTIFENTSGGGLRLNAGELVRGIETNANKTPTGNGGTLDFRAPNNVIWLDGNIDVSAIRNGNAYTGSGGKVFVESAYLFQNGNIFANGVNGGLVQMNVGGMTMGPNSKITANGFGGDGGSISINATGAVNIGKGALLDTSGKVLGTFDTNVINVEGGVVNNSGVIRANGVATADFKPDNGDSALMAANPQLANNPVPGPISAGDGTHDTATMSNILFATPGNVDFRGGTIRLVASGQTEAPKDLLSSAAYNQLTAIQRDIVNKNGSAPAGRVTNNGTLEANGALSKNGGTIIIAAAQDINNLGTIRANGASATNGVFDGQGNGANGGDGGTISINAMHKVSNTGQVEASGGNGGNSQSVAVSTGNGQDAFAQVTGHAGQGGQGGLIALSSPAIKNKGNFVANGGRGGNGGDATAVNIVINPFGAAVSHATAIAGQGGQGGQGGLVVVSGDVNPAGNGKIVSNGGQGGNGGNAVAEALAASLTTTPSATASATRGTGGTGGTAGQLVVPNPTTFHAFSAKNGGLGNTGAGITAQVTNQFGHLIPVVHRTNSTVGQVVSGPNKAPLATRQNEYLRHEENAILITQAGGAGTASQTLSGRLSDALIRTVSNPTGTSINTLANAESAGNFVVSSTAHLDLTNDLANSNINPLFFNLNTSTILNNGNLTNKTLWTPGVHVIGAGFHDIEFALGGGHISWLANGTVTNNQIVMTRGLWSGGSTSVAATQDIVNNKDFIDIGPNRPLLEGFSLTGPLYESSHAGSLTLKAGRDLVNASTGKLESNQIFFDIHPPLNQNPPIGWPKFLNGAQIGATVNLLAHRNLTNAGLIQADAMTFRNGQLGADNPSLATGGIITGRAATGTFTNTGSITANGSAFFSPNETVSPFFSNNTFPTTTSFNGNIDIH